MEGTSYKLGEYTKIYPGTVPARAIFTKHRYASQYHKSWRAPATTILASLAGLVAALSHHFMNTYLNGKQLDEVVVSQTWISRFGTALAFLVKMCFVISVGVAFIQRHWLNFHHESFKIKEIDAITSVLSNALSLFSGLVWLRYPILTMVAIISWTIPLAAVIAPGSLTVQPVHSSNTTQLQVPQPSFNATAYAQIGTGSMEGTISADDLVYRLAYVTAMSAQPVSLTSAYQNETYHMDFIGPAIKCGMANSSVIQKLSAAYDPPPSGSGNSVPFVSWVAGDEHDLFNCTVETFPNTDSPTYYQTLDTSSPDAASIFVMSSLFTYSENNVITQASGGNVTVTECRLHNATYHVDFDFQYPKQTVKASIRDYLNPVSAYALSQVNGFYGNSTASAIYAYNAMMDAFGKLIVGQSEYSHYGFTTDYFTSYALLAVNWTDAGLTQRGLEQLFQNITMSMLSDPTLIKNSTEADWIPVQVTSYPIEYVYHPEDLLLAYGLAFFCALASMLVGMHAFFINDASYQDNFSTFVRVTGGQELHSLIDPGDSGADPVPRGLAEARIMMPGRRRGYDSASE